MVSSNQCYRTRREISAEEISNGLKCLDDAFFTQTTFRDITNFSQEDCSYIGKSSPEKLYSRAYMVDKDLNKVEDPSLKEGGFRVDKSSREKFVSLYFISLKNPELLVKVLEITGWTVRRVYGKSIR